MAVSFLELLLKKSLTPKEKKEVKVWEKRIDKELREGDLSKRVRVEIYKKERTQLQDFKVLDVLKELYLQKGWILDLEEDEDFICLDLLCFDFYRVKFMVERLWRSHPEIHPHHDRGGMTMEI